MPVWDLDGEKGAYHFLDPKTISNWKQSVPWNPVSSVLKGESDFMSCKSKGMLLAIAPLHRDKWRV